MEFGKRLKETLTWKGISQTELANMLGVNKASITDWIKGRCAPNLELFYRICLILKESAGYLLGLED